MAAMKGGNWGNRSSRRMKSVQHEECETHGEKFAFFCETCSDLFCEKCAHGKHKHDHIVLQVDAAADSYRRRLTKTKNEIGMVDNELEQISNSLEEVKSNCNREANDIKTKIREAANSLMDIITKREYELCQEVDQKKATVINQIKETETRKNELSLSTDNVKGICDQLQDDLAKYNFKRKEVIERLPGRSAILQRELSQLKMVRQTGAIGICFEPEYGNTAIPIGYLLKSGKGNQLQVSVCDGRASRKDSLVKFKSMECGEIGKKVLPKTQWFYKFQGCCLLTVDSMIESFVEPHTGDYAYFVWNKAGSPSQSLRVDISRTDKCLNVSPTACDGGNSFFVYNETTIMKLEVKEPTTLEFASKMSTPVVEMKVNTSATLSDGYLHKISAVCYDEQTKCCYALLQDGMTIKFIQFDSNVPDKFHLKLNKMVKCAGSCGFQVTGFGMAICDLTQNEVRYYASVSSSEATCVVKSPQKIKGACPACVTASKKDRKWYVVWQYEVRGTHHSSIYQYSMSMQNEHLLLEIGTDISSLGILDDKYISIQSQYGTYISRVSVYNIQSTC